VKVSVDKAVCISNGLCVAIAPEVFDLDPEGVLMVLVEEGVDFPPDSAVGRRSLSEAAASCPVGAIKVWED
jgi:ferredoxin